MCASGVRRREPERVPDRPRGDLVVADEPGQDRQSGGVGTRPARGSKGVRAKVPGRTAARSPVVAVRAGIEQLVEATCVLVDHEHVAVTGRIRSRLRSAGSPGSGSRPGRTRRRSRRRPAVRGRRARHELVRDAVPGVRAEVHVKPVIQADRRDHRRPSSTRRRVRRSGWFHTFVPGRPSSLTRPGAPGRAGSGRRRGVRADRRAEAIAVGRGLGGTYASTDVVPPRVAREQPRTIPSAWFFADASLDA